MKANKFEAFMTPTTIVNKLFTGTSECLDRGLRFVHRHPPNFLYLAGGIGPLVSRILPEDTSGSTVLLGSLAAGTATILPQALFSLTREKAFRSAYEKNDAATVRAMLRSGFIPAQTGLKNLLYLAISKHHSDTAKVLIEHLSLEDLLTPHNGRTPLAYAYLQNQKEIVQTLIERLPEEETRSISRFIFDPQNQRGILRDDEINIGAIIHEYLGDQPTLIESYPQIPDIANQNMKRSLKKEMQPIFELLPPEQRDQCKAWINEINLENQIFLKNRIRWELYSLLKTRAFRAGHFFRKIGTVLTHGTHFKSQLLELIKDAHLAIDGFEYFLSLKKLDEAAAVAVLIPESVFKTWRLEYLAKAYLTQNPPDANAAFQIASTMRHEEAKFCGLWLSIAEAYLAQNPPNIRKAEEIKSLIQDNLNKSTLANSLSTAYLTLNPPNLDAAFSHACTIGKLGGQYQLLKIAEAYLAQNPPNIGKAEEIKNLIQDNDCKSILVKYLINAYLTKNPPDLDGAFSLACTSEEDRTLRLFDIAKAYLAQNPPNIEKAEEIENIIEDSWKQVLQWQIRLSKLNKQSLPVRRP